MGPGGSNPSPTAYFFPTGIFPGRVFFLLSGMASRTIPLFALGENGL